MDTDYFVSIFMSICTGLIFPLTCLSATIESVWSAQQTRRLPDFVFVEQVSQASDGHIQNFGGAGLIATRSL